MAFTPGGGPGGSRGPSRSSRTTAAGPGAADIRRVLHWALIMGGLVSIVDLGMLALQQRSPAADPANDPLQIVNLAFSVVLYSMAGASTARDTGRIAFGALAGLLAGTLDGLLIGAASSAILPRDGQAVSAQLVWLDLLVQNLTLGTLLAGIAAWVSSRVRRGGPPKGTGPGTGT